MTGGKLILMKLTLVWGIFSFTLCCSSEAEVLQGATSAESSERMVISEYPSKIDTFFVIHFHPTVQCSCCINVGSFARKALEKFYAESRKDSIIVFKEHDIDQDSSTAKKYEIFWSALGFEKFRGGKREFKEIESVWEFCEDEKNFLLNFKKELDEFIVGLKKTESKDQDSKQDSAEPISKESE